MSDPGLYEWLEVFDRLTWTGLITVAEGDLFWELRRLTLTNTGNARYAALCEQRHEDLAVPPPEFGTTQTPIGRRSSDPRPPAPGSRSGPT